MELSGHSLQVYSAKLLERGLALFKKCSMERLTLPSHLKDIKCVIYLDRDALVLKSLRFLYARACQLNTRLIGAVPNASPWYPTWKHGTENVGVTYVPQTGIQAGILTMNLELMRATNFEKTIVGLAETAPFTTLGDQDLLNFYFANRTGKIELLECMYNLRMYKGRVECDCYSLAPSAQSDCSKYSSIDDAVVLHGNRGIFRQQLGLFPTIWRTFLSMEVLYGKTNFISIQSNQSYASLLMQYTQEIKEML